MRLMAGALVLSIAFITDVRGAAPPEFGDAALHAVQFVDRREGWVVGDEGVVWHTIDGGESWERQPTGVRASLRSLHFLTPYTGWVCGRSELPHGAGSEGVLLFTQDGGLRWQRASRYSLPGLNRIRFLDNKNGFVAGDGTEQFPTGLFVTADGGRTWKPVPGPRCPSWLALDLNDAPTGALAGAWSRLAVLRDGTLAAADVDLLGGRNVRGLYLAGNRAAAVGQGGLVFLSDTAGAKWGFAENVPLTPELRADWDFHAVHGAGDHLWAVGRPGSRVLHSPDGGRSWEILNTNQPLPLNGLCFVDDQAGWAVGEFGTVIHTLDGGKTWRIQRRGGQRAAVLCVHAGPTGVPLDTVALLGAQEGYLTVGVRVTSADPASALLSCATDGERLAAAMRGAGGAAGELLWQFPLPQHLAALDQRALLGAWDRLHADRSAEQLLRQLVLALRIWRPSVVITDHPDPKATAWPAEALIAEAVHEAFMRALDPTVFPEQLQNLGLEPWQAAKLYGHWETDRGASVSLDLTDLRPELGGAARDFAAPAAALLSDDPAPLPAQRHYRLLASRIDGAGDHRDLMEGVALAPEGVARRATKVPVRLPADVAKVRQARRSLQALAEAPAGNLADPGKLLGQLGPALKHLPEDQAAAALFAVASHFARTGQWEFAREIFLFMVDRYPADARSADAYRWLIRHNSSSEARRRHERGQFLLVGRTEYEATEGELAPAVFRPGQKKSSSVQGVDVREVHDQLLAGLSNRAEARRWYQGSLEVGDRLAAFGPLFATDPGIQFCLQSARRHLGDFEGARRWYARFCADHPAGPWRDAAAAELWLTNRTGPPPKPVVWCRQTATRPFLDGSFDDPCWQGHKPIKLRDAVGATAKEYPTEAWLAFDAEYLYLALRCRHPEDRYLEPVKSRSPDADLRAYDRVSLLLDLDRDYATCFHLQVDQRGCVADECWGDPSWNPRWFVALRSDKTGWQVEAAIPLAELTGDGVTPGQAWACNVVRVLPGHGVQAFSLPAEVQPRPEGMGLLLFAANPGEMRKPNPTPAGGEKAMPPSRP